MSRYTAQRLSASFDRALTRALAPLAGPGGAITVIEPDAPLSASESAQLEVDQRQRRADRVQAHRERIRDDCMAQAQRTIGVAGQPFLPRRR